MTNPLGGITLTSYDPANNVIQTTDESNNFTWAPNVVTNYTYTGDNQFASTTVDPGGSLAATTKDSYDPDGNLFCSASADAVKEIRQLPVPALGGQLDHHPACSHHLFYSTSPGSQQANKVTATFYDANGRPSAKTRPRRGNVDTHGGRQRAHLLQLPDPTDVSTWLTGHPVWHLPLVCPGRPATPPPPAQGSNPGYVATDAFHVPAGRTSSSTGRGRGIPPVTPTPRAGKP